MLALARDISNFSNPLTLDLLAMWQATGVGLVIAQSLIPPAGYPAGKTRAQIETCSTAGMPVDIYLYVWTNSDVEADMQAKLALLAGLEPSIRKVWLDVEDSSEAPVATRLDTIRRALVVVDQWCLANSKPPAGIYTAAWFVNSYLGSTTEFSARPLWAAQYDNIADTTVFTPFGGWSECAIKQHAGSQPDGTDLDVLSAAEEASLTQPGPDRQTPADWPWPTWEEAADNFKGIADALGPQVAALQAQLDTLKASLSAQQLGVLVAQLAQTAKDRDAAVAARNLALAKITKAKLALA